MVSSKLTKYFESGKWLLVLFLLVTGPMGFGSCQDDDGGGDGPEETPAEKTCVASIFGLSTDIIPILPKCLFGGNAINLRLTNIFQALPRIYCVLKCVFAELTVFSPDGTLDEVSALLFFQEAIPEYALPPIVEQAQPCLALAAGFKPEQYFCQSYAPFIQCLAGTLVTGIGPFALECFGTPLFAGLFGLLNFVVPPERSVPAEARRIIGGVNNGTIGASTRAASARAAKGPHVSKFRERQKMLREQYALAQAQARVNSPPSFAGLDRDRDLQAVNNNRRVVAPTRQPPTPTSSPAFFSNNHNNNRWKNTNNRERMNPVNTLNRSREYNKNTMNTVDRSGWGTDKVNTMNAPDRDSWGRDFNVVNRGRDSMNTFSRGRPMPPSFNVDFLFEESSRNDKFKENYKKYISQYRTNNTDTVVYQMDRITNLAKSLQLLTNNTAKFF